MGWIIGAVGIFSLTAAVFNWDWFMDHRKARFFIRLFGRTGARVFYGILGAAFIALSILLGAGIVQNSR